MLAGGDPGPAPAWLPHPAPPPAPPGKMKVKQHPPCRAQADRPQRGCAHPLALVLQSPRSDPPARLPSAHRMARRLRDAGGVQGPEGPGQVNSPSAGAPHLTAGWGGDGEPPGPGSKAAPTSPGPPAGGRTHGAAGGRRSPRVLGASVAGLTGQPADKRGEGTRALV